MSKIGYILVWFLLLISFHSKGQEIKDTITFKNIFGTVLTNDKDVVLFRKDELINLHFTNSKDSISIEKFCIKKYLFNAVLNEFQPHYIKCHIPQYRYDNTLDSLKNIDYESINFMDNVDSAKKEKDVIQKYQLDKNISFTLINKERKFSLIYENNGKLKSTEISFNYDTHPNGVTLEFYGNYPNIIISVNSFFSETVFVECYLIR